MNQSKYGGIANKSHQSNTSQISPRSQYNQNVINNNNNVNNPFNQTGGSIGNGSTSTNTANIKGKITAIEVSELTKPHNIYFI